MTAGHETRRDPVAEIAAIPDPQERLAWIAERGRGLPPLPPELRTPGHRVPGCVSPVWLVDESRHDGVCRFRGDAEAPILRGLVALVCERASGRPAADIAVDDIDLLATLRLERQLSPTRAHGLRSLQAHVRRLAAARVAGLPKP